VHIRPAQLSEAALLTELALRAKAYWGYNAEFMEAARADLAVTTTQLATQSTFVLERNGDIAGFYKLREVTSSLVELTDLFVDADTIGQGWGRRLWDHAVATARSRGYFQMTFESDPNAEGFYLHMGAQRIGEVESSVKPGRYLPRMLYPLQPDRRDGGDKM
jgi:ribosomal protein S18 acetylase RimI-like enzyme